MRPVRIAIAALAIGVIGTAPGLASASSSATVDVRVTVLPSATISTTQEATTESWNGMSAVSVPFSIAVGSNEAAGYEFTMTGSNASTGAFTLNGSGSNAVHPTYTVTGSGAGESYTNGVGGTAIHAGVSSAEVIGFTVHLPVLRGVVPDEYTDTLHVTVNVL